MAWARRRGCGGAFPLSPERGCVVSVGKDGALLNIEPFGGTLVVEDDAIQLNTRIGDKALRIFKGQQD